jgi:CRP/FNR family transcriptional regulator, cyclic AMP receptor protein
MLNQVIARVSMFEDFGQDEVNLINPLLELASFQKDQIIFQQGQLATYLYFLLEGEVLVRFKPYDGPTLNITRVVPNGVFGWSAALRRSAYTSEAIATMPSEAVRIRGEQLRHLCEQYPKMGVVILDRLANVIAERLRSTHEQVVLLLSEGLDLGNNQRRIESHE